jgi:hypothetical protein
VWARNKKLAEIEIPGKEIEIYKLKINEVDSILGRKIAESVIRNVENLKGDFRQKEIIDSWKTFLGKYENFKFKKIKIEVECSSGSHPQPLRESQSRWSRSSVVRDARSHWGMPNCFRPPSTPPWFHQ